MEKITVIIPTYNRSKVLTSVLPSYANDPLVERIIIVNDGSTDNTSKVLKALASKLSKPIQIIENQRRLGAPKSRNIAVSATKSNWLLMGEDDVWLEQNYASILLSQAQALDASIIAGRIINVRMGDEFSATKLRDNGDVFASSLFDIQNFSARYDAKFPHPVQAPYVHMVALIRSDVFMTFHFNAHYRGTAFREETDFQLKVRAAGLKIFLSPNALCYHIRGPLSISGGQRGRRLNWPKIEFWALINTWIMVRKHWRFLASEHGFVGRPNSWMLQVYIPQRLKFYSSRIISGRISKTWS